ncbi:hypothetical protein [Paenibacillus sp. YIM B09110]|uniref:hypothetical protein n=1 Tax=Paenibacillus sp. YIM B09110 TaxID=3126102 RepID=UPI00301E5305
MKRFNIERAPLVNLYVATDKHKRLRLSADLIDLYRLDEGNRVELGFDISQRAIALQLAANSADPTAANIDKRGYISASRFFARARMEPASQRYTFAAEQDGWLVFVAEE